VSGFLRNGKNGDFPAWKVGKKFFWSVSMEKEYNFPDLIV